VVKRDTRPLWPKHGGPGRPVAFEVISAFIRQQKYDIIGLADFSALHGKAGVVLI